IGIDLGTTQSLVGVVDAGFPILLADAQGSRMTRSVVYYGGAEAAPVVGAEAWRRRVTEGARTVVSVKRLIGRRAGDHAMEDGKPDRGSDGEPEAGGRFGGMGPEVRAGADGSLGIVMDGVWRSPIEISAAILRRLKEVAEAALERPVARAVITVPAYFNDAQRQATREAGRLAGLKVERILNEPTAAALAFGLDKLGGRSRVAVYDLGGGTFDVSILELNDGIFQVLATHGDTRLGGDDFDLLLAQWLASELEGGWSGLTSLERARFLESAVEAKHALSFQEEVEVRLPFWRGAESFVRTVTRREFEKLIKPLLERTGKLCRKAMSDAGLTPADLSAAVLVGGSTRLPAVREIAAEIFGREPDTSRHPDETVALGAVIQAGILSGAMRRVVLLDVTPLSLGIETFGGLMNVILPRNTTIPAKAGELFTNAVTDQPGMRIRVLQGEREMARDNWTLGEFEVGFEKGPKGSARVGVQFSIDADGILTILARDTKTGLDKVVEIRHAAVDVSEAKVGEMIAQSVDHAFEDMTERQWAEAALKSRELLDAVAGALPLAGDALDDSARGEIRQGVAGVEAALEAGDLRRLKTANATLDEATETLAAILVEQAMDAAVAKKMGI
ncbi:MAG: dnaK, partial [Verrucomicrobiales bacterium]|nr:dnaK [Verrucomicrobiales bacterium]